MCFTANFQLINYPLLFTIYILSLILHQHGFNDNLYPDDIQIHTICMPALAIQTELHCGLNKRMAQLYFFLHGQN